MEDLKNVLNEAPMPEHLVRQMKMEQKKEEQKKEEANAQLKKEVVQPQQLPQQQKEPSKDNLLQKPPVPQHKPNSSPGDQKQQIVQNIIAKKEEEKQAQQLLAKQNYHYKNRDPPQPNQQQVQQPPVSNRKHSADGRRYDQPVRQENAGPKIVSHQPEAQPKDIRAGGQREPDNRGNFQKKPEPSGNLNPNRWEKKPISEPHQKVQPQQQFDPFPDKKDAFKKPPMDPRMKPQPQPEPKRAVDREIMGGGGGMFGGFANPNFAPNKRKENHSRDAPRKRNESAERQNKPAPRQNFSSEKKPAPQLAQKNEAALQKIAEANLKKQKEDELKKQKQEEERLARQAEAEQKRLEREKAREAQRQQMQMDIQKKRNMMKHGGGDIKVEFVGAKISPNDTERSEETADTQPSDDKRSARDQVVSNKGSRNRSETPNQQKRKQWNAEPQVSEPKKENKRIVYQDPDANKEDKFKVEIYVPSTSKEKRVSSGADDDAESAPKDKKYPPRPNAWNARQKVEEVKDDGQNENMFPGANKKEEEEIINYAAMLKELENIVTEPANLDNNGSDSLGKNDPNVIMENDEDREDDDQDDDTSKAPSKDKAEGTPGEENIDFISDYQKLESLKIFMEDSLGEEIFIKAYRITKELFDKNANLEEIEQKYAKEDSYASLYPFIPTELRRKYLPLMFTFVIMEDIAEESMKKQE